MPVDPSEFHKLNVTDTCAVWNILSSKTLYETAKAVGCNFSVTRFVYYECLLKRRSKMEITDQELRSRLVAEREKGQFREYHLEIADLQDVEILEKRRNLGMGELSSIAFARRTRQAFITDDQGARKLASEVMEHRKVQTTPHLFGWLIYNSFLSDRDKDVVLQEHLEVKGDISKYLQEIYERALLYRLNSRKQH